MAENENDFYVDEYGEIHRKDAPQRVENDALWREYQQLEYEFFHTMIKVRKSWRVFKNWKSNWA